MRRASPSPARPRSLRCTWPTRPLRASQASSTSSPAGRKLPVSKQLARAGQPCKNRSTPWVVLKGAAGLSYSSITRERPYRPASSARRQTPSTMAWVWRSRSWGGSSLSRKPGMTRSFLAPR